MHLKHTCFAINLKFQKGTFIHLAQQEVHVHRSGWTPSNSHAPTNATCIGYVYKTMSFVCGSDFPLFFFKLILQCTDMKNWDELVSSEIPVRVRNDRISEICPRRRATRICLEEHWHFSGRGFFLYRLWCTRNAINAT